MGEDEEESNPSPILNASEFSTYQQKQSERLEAMGTFISKGWVMSGSVCEKEECGGVPLFKNPSNLEEEVCSVCVWKEEHEKQDQQRSSNGSQRVIHQSGF